MNINDNGTADWGLMQINQAEPIALWDWEANIAKGKQIYAQKEELAKSYLGQHPPINDLMILQETLQLYNGGHYYRWAEEISTWIPDPKDGMQGYVHKIMGFISSKPWPLGEATALANST